MSLIRHTKHILLFAAVSYGAIIGSSAALTSKSGINLLIPTYNGSSSPIVLTYKAKALGDTDFPKGQSNNSATLTWSSSPVSGVYFICSVRKFISSSITS